MSDDTYDFHPIANLFPLIEGDEFDNLCADIRANGLRQNIILFEGKILDGRNRYRGCKKVGERPRFIEYLGNDPFGYVAALNLLRRHLSPSQRGMIAAEMANMKRGDNQHSAGGSAPVPILNYESKSNDLTEACHSEPSVNLISQADAAKRMGVSTRTVTSAAKVIERGAPELVQAVKSGDVSVKTAASIVSLPAADQSQIVSKGPEAVADAAKGARASNEPLNQKGAPRASQTDSEIMLRTWGRANSFQRERFLREASPSVADVRNGMKQTTGAEVSDNGGGDV